jgi:hypothetical protein
MLSVIVSDSWHFETDPEPDSWICALYSIYKDNKSFRSHRTVEIQCGSGMFIPDTNIFHPGSAYKNLSFNLKKLFLSSRKYYPGCSSRIRILSFYPSRIQGSKRHRIPQCSGSMTFWGGSGSESPDPCLWLMDPDSDPDPAIFVSSLTFKMPTKN